ncbi:hypothetical protein IU450_24765 [Nocardia abscessus]|uniref:hypothetical protein n=1 Tax=Nocardia abscessus TaxID=120957 RepID=UPI0018940A8E|nr:hypothetical protein [Nocardia abscessus]
MGRSVTTLSGGRFALVKWLVLRKHCPEPKRGGTVQTHVQLSVFARAAAPCRVAERVIGFGGWAMTAAVEPPAFDPCDCGFREDPYPMYRRLREEAPPRRDPALNLGALSQHADVALGSADVHFCPGAHLARSEATVVLHEFGLRVRSYDVPESGIAHVHSSDVRGLAHLPITVETR